MPRNSTLLSNDTAAASPLTQGTTVTAVQAGGATSHRQPRQCHGKGPKTVKRAQSDRNYVSRLLLDCVAHVCRGGGIIVTRLVQVTDLRRRTGILHSAACSESTVTTSQPVIQLLTTSPNAERSATFYCYANQR